MSTERFLHHLECPSGLAGDMFLGACLDLGMPLEPLQTAALALGLAGVEVESRKAHRGGIGGTRFRVLRDGVPIEGPDPDEAPRGAAAPAPILAETHGHGAAGAGSGSGVDAARHHHGEHATHGHAQGPGRDFAEIRRLIERSGLAAPARERSVAMFARLAEVEGAIHGVPAERVHFHEVGAIDSIVDVMGACLAREWLGGPLTCGVVVTGGGTTATAHGVLPVPSPATAALLIGVPTEGGGEGELLTPTGALILAHLVDGFGAAPPMVPVAHGYGLGRWDPPGRPNAARLTRGRALAGSRSDVTVLECQVDDLPGEGAGYTMERLLEAGALDVYFTPVQMKKNRPGVLLTVLCRPELSDALARMLLEETGSLGCRFQAAQRLEAERHLVEVTTRFGTVRVKIGALAGRALGASPEFEDCRRLAREHGVSWREVYRAAVVASEGAERSG